MAIPIELLASTESRALGFVVYGGPGLRKTNAIHTLPAPILMQDFEGGTSSLLPWIRRRRNWDSSEWYEYSDEQRQQSYEMLNESSKKWIQDVTRIPPKPYIDVVWYDNMNVFAYNTWVSDLGNFNPKSYSSIACDSLQEQSASMKTATKGQGNEMKEMATISWAKVQDQNAAALRAYRNLRQKGVFIYLTCSEDVDKDYVTDPRNTPQGQRPEQPYSIKGNVNVSGKIVQAVQHTTDVQFHARPMGASIVWVKDPEPIGQSGAMWEAKDRTGRIRETYNSPNIRGILDQIYGEELRKKIYSAGLTQQG